MPKRIMEETLKEYLDRRRNELSKDVDKYDELANTCTDEDCKLEYQLNYDIARAVLKELNNIDTLCQKRKRY